ncbi:MAG TPA: response regulator [Treponemataceae bacterium]|nr:response regulator [Treponemataceae bacterium]
MSDNSRESSERTRFLATTIHEIRTPIQTIIGTLELLSETKLDKEQSEYLRQVKFSADVLLNLANDVLDLSKLQSGKFNIEIIPFNVAQTAEQVMDLICIEAHNRGLEIITDIDYSLPLTIMGDPTRTQQIILNLVKNAVKFTKKGYVQLCVSYNSPDSTLLFEIRDSGIGIPDEKQNKIFSDYYQVDDSTTREYGGTGLGLSICRSLVKRLGGEIGLKPNPSGGSVFWFTLPLVTDSEQPADKHYTAQDAETRILLVDDHILSLESLSKKLKTFGFKHIHAATSGQMALDMMRSAAEKNEPYKLVLIDMIMPGMDGWRLSAEINADHTINNAKLYLMVPEGQMGGDAKMKMLDWFNGYLYKPIKKAMLIEVLDQIKSDEPMDLEIVEAVEEFVLLEEPDKDDEKPEYPFAVLVAEDHPINQKLLKTFLEQLNVSVFTADNGEEAVKQTAKHPEIQLIFMDIQMPVMTGIEASENIRKNGYEGIIIACTANTDTDDYDRYLKAGMNDILVKPFKKREVEIILNKWSSAVTLILPEELENTKYDTKGSIFWDSDDLLDTVGSDIFLAEQLINQYIEQTRVFLIKAKEALFQYNFQSLSRVAHSLKGSSASISAVALLLSARNMENAANNSRFDESREQLNDFSALFAKFVAAAGQTITGWQEKK